MNENIISLKQKTAQLSIATISLLLMLKISVGIYTNTVSIISEAIHSAVDLIATLITYYAIKKSANSPDDNHHYGHGKFENISGTLEGLLIISAALWIIYEAYEKYNSANIPILLTYGMLIMVISVAANYFVSKKMMTVAKETNSPALEADALHLKTDMWTSGGILTGLILLYTTKWVWIDSVIAVAIALLIFKTGYMILKKNISELTDISLPKEEEQLICQIVNQHDQVISMEQLRTRHSGSFRLIDMHVFLDKHMSLDKAHDVCSQLESKIKHRIGICDITIHLEPDKGKTTPIAHNKFKNV